MILAQVQSRHQEDCLEKGMAAHSSVPAWKIPGTGEPGGLPSMGSHRVGPSKEHPGLISFRMDWLNPLAVHGTLKSLLQYHSSTASILRHSAFFIVQLSHPYMTTGKTIALTRQIFVDKVMSLLFNMLSNLVITLLPRSKRQLISSRPGP